MRIAIAGYGVEGRANYTYFSREFPDAEVVVVDEREQLDEVPEGAQTLLGEGVFSRLDNFDMVVRTAGLTPRKVRTDGKVWSATNEFFAKCPAPIIGVTGTKGKGTTCSLIASVLRATGKMVHLVGNIGTPALDVLRHIQSDDIVVYELSSFQLWDLEKSPHIAVVLMIEPDHLDVHESFSEYIQAKSNIVRWQTAGDVVIYHPTNEFSHAIAQVGQGTKQRYGVPDDNGAYVKSNTFFVQENAICGVDTLHIAGVHNRENACAALSAVKTVTPDVTNQQIAEGLAAFDGLPHRLKFVAEVDGVRYYDDSIATTPGSVIAAVRSFDAPKVLLMGGHDKGGDYDELLNVCKGANVKIVAYGANRDTLKQLFDAAGVPCVVVLGDMRAVVTAARAHVAPDSVVILSPAAASFDMFRSYAERGDQFIAAVKELR